jgi:hypothetical protein
MLPPKQTARRSDFLGLRLMTIVLRFIGWLCSILATWCLAGAAWLFVFERQNSGVWGFIVGLFVSSIVLLVVTDTCWKSATRRWERNTIARSREVLANVRRGRDDPFILLLSPADFVSKPTTTMLELWRAEDHVFEHAKLLRQGLASPYFYEFLTRSAKLPVVRTGGGNSSFDTTSAPTPDLLRWLVGKASKIYIVASSSRETTVVMDLLQEAGELQRPVYVVPKFSKSKALIAATDDFRDRVGRKVALPKPNSQAKLVWFAGESGVVAQVSAKSLRRSGADYDPNARSYWERVQEDLIIAQRLRGDFEGAKETTDPTDGDEPG